jgi:hypothetical protein
MQNKLTMFVYKIEFANVKSTFGPCGAWQGQFVVSSKREIKLMFIMLFAFHA